MEKLPWNPSKDVIRVSANNLGIDIDRAIYTAMAIGLLSPVYGACRKE